MRIEGNSTEMMTVNVASSEEGKNSEEKQGQTSEMKKD